jgi:NitT/TauT family transport system substrate-binding protein
MEKPGRLAVLAAVMLAVACHGRDRAASGLINVRIAVGGQSQLIYLPTTLTRELGYYKDEGLNVEIEDLAGGSKALEALMGGSVDVVSGFYDHTIQMAAEGRELVAFVTMLRSPGLVLVSSPQSVSPPARIEDLKGRIVGVTAAGSSSQMLLTYLLSRHGVAADAVSITSIGTAATAIAAIERGKVDAGMMADPAFTLVLRRNPGVRVLADLRQAAGVRAAFGSPSYPASVLYAPGEWLRGHRDTAARLARAVRRTLVWMGSHSPQEIADRMPPAFRGEDQALYVEALKNSMPMYSPDGMMEADGAELVHTLLAQTMDKVRLATIDLSKTYTNEFIHAQDPGEDRPAVRRF